MKSQVDYSISSAKQVARNTNYALSAVIHHESLKKKVNLF